MSQDPESEPGTYTLDVKALARPRNDERESATRVVPLPASLVGTTVGATRDDRDPSCTAEAPSVWYRVDSARTERVVARLHAKRGIETGVCALKKVRSHLRVVDRDGTDDRGNASVAFKSGAGSTYFVAVSRPTPQSGQFALAVQRPDEPPVVPGKRLRRYSGQGHLDPLVNPQDAWAVNMEKGTTYRLTLVTSPDECVSMTIYSVRASSFRNGVVAADFTCGETEFFAPGPDGGGTYPVLLTARTKATSYRLFVSPVEPDDSGPGVAIESGSRVVGFVSAADPLDLYRFDVPGTSNVEILLTSKSYVDVELKDSYGHTIRALEPNTTTERVLGAGTYYLAVTPSEQGSRYALRPIVRFLTTTSLTVDGASSATVRPGEIVSLLTTTAPYPGSGVTEVQADFFDVATGTWQFRQLWEVEPGSAISFTPDAVGRWRVRATFKANDVASTSRTKYCAITVTTV